MDFNIFLLILHVTMKKIPFIPLIIGTGFGSGFWPWGPGTAGALLATVMWLVFSLFLSELELFTLTLFLIIVFTAAGTWATHRLVPFWGEDPKKVVVDEMVGVWIPLLASPIGEYAITKEEWCYAFVSFVLFRFFDILKPLGIRKIDRKQGAFFVMADDIVAGIYSLIIIILLRWAI